MNSSKTFISGLENQDLSILKTVPKTDLHNHAFFSTKRKNIEEWANCSIDCPPSKFKNLDEMGEYAASEFVPYIASKEGVEFVFTSAIQDAIDDGVTILEMSFDSRIIMLYNSFSLDMITFLKELKIKFQNKILFLPELGISRDHEFKEIEATLKECIESKIFNSIDLYGNEDAAPCEKYLSIYKDAKSAGMKLKAHVGEFGSAKSIRHTVEVLKLDNVQHGISAHTSPEIMDWLANNKIQLNICPTSNVALSRAKSMKEHLIRILFDYGVPVTINSDDLTIFNQSVSDEFLNLYNAELFSANELNQIRETGI